MLILIGSILYICELAITMYDIYCTMLDTWMKPDLYRRPNLWVAFEIGKKVLFVATYFVLYRAVGLYVTLGVGALRFIISNRLMHKFYNQRVAVWYGVYLNTICKEQTSDGNRQLSDTEIEEEAMKMARQTATKAMRNEPAY